MLNTLERVSSSKRGKSGLEGFRLRGVAGKGHAYISIHGYGFGVAWVFLTGLWSFLSGSAGTGVRVTSTLYCTRSRRLCLLRAWSRKLWGSWHVRAERTCLTHLVCVLLYLRNLGLRTGDIYCGGAPPPPHNGPDTRNSTLLPAWERPTEFIMLRKGLFFPSEPQPVHFLIAIL